MTFIPPTAYEILVASDEKNIKADTGDMWESGKVDSDQSVHIVYAGKELQSGQKYF
jgi:alpha-L-rhamnosidase